MQKVSQISAVQWGHTWWQYTLQPFRYPRFPIPCEGNIQSLVYCMPEIKCNSRKCVTSCPLTYSPLRPTEAHWAVITGILLWLSILSSWITSHIISTFVHARRCQEPYVWHVYKSKSSSPFGLRLPDTSHRWSHAVKYGHERSPYTVPRAHAEPIARYDKCT